MNTTKKYYEEINLELVKLDTDILSSSNDAEWDELSLAPTKGGVDLFGDMGLIGGAN